MMHDGEHVAHCGGSGGASGGGGGGGGGSAKLSSPQPPTRVSSLPKVTLSERRQVASPLRLRFTSTAPMSPSPLPPLLPLLLQMLPDECVVRFTPPLLCQKGHQ
ncbi:hypothetical protein TcWFU_003923 [Taenia crassiceps]|uniref:Uncharacterized protein n=1 Tax=Taenia crassiceps TaxID=6207 RepID=A0ABR4Q4T8_9CEST